MQNTVMSTEVVIFGFYRNLNKDEKIINHIILEAKRYIFRCKQNEQLPSLQGYVKCLKRTFHLEYIIARERSKLDTHNRKWKSLEKVLAPLFQY
jgi:hypothetical protein